jgi:hypothetical protein
MALSEPLWERPQQPEAASQTAQQAAHDEPCHDAVMKSLLHCRASTLTLLKGAPLALQALLHRSTPHGKWIQCRLPLPQPLLGALLGAGVHPSLPVGVSTVWRERARTVLCSPTWAARMQAARISTILNVCSILTILSLQPKMGSNAGLAPAPPPGTTTAPIPTSLRAACPQPSSDRADPISLPPVPAAGRRLGGSGAAAG